MIGMVELSPWCEFYRSEDCGRQKKDATGPEFGEQLFEDTMEEHEARIAGEQPDFATGKSLLETVVLEAGHGVLL